MRSIDGNDEVAAPREPISSGGDQPLRGDHIASVPLDETIIAIRAAHRERCFWMEQRKRADLTLGAYLRSALGWSPVIPAAEREAIRKEAARLIAAGEKFVKAEMRGKPIPRPDLGAHFGVVTGQLEGRLRLGGYDDLEAAATQTMEREAKALPVYGWAAQQRGLGALGLAIIVGEAGDLANYATKGKLFKRLGLAVIDGKRQGGLGKNAPKAEWIAHGYSPKRRSRIWTIGASVLMSGNTHYREIYLDRKAYEVAVAEAEGLIVAPSAKIPAKDKDKYRSLKHVDNRARRYMEKRLIHDLWKAWRAAIGKSETINSVPPAEFRDAAE